MVLSQYMDIHILWCCLTSMLRSRNVVCNSEEDLLVYHSVLTLDAFLPFSKDATVYFELGD